MDVLQPNDSETLGSTSDSLLVRVTRHDPDAWARLVQLYGPLVFRWCRKWHLQPGDFDDVFQEVFQAVASSIHRFHRNTARSTFRGWLWTITRNKLADHFRQIKRLPNAAGGSSANWQLAQLEAADAGAPDQDLEEIELVQRALQLVKTDFNDLTWQAFLLTVVEHRRPADVALELGISLDSVYQAKSRVIRRVRTELDGLIE